MSVVDMAALALLRRLAGERLPLTITDSQDIVLVRALAARDLIAAVFGTHGDRQAFARVLAIAKEGRSALAIGDARERR